MECAPVEPALELQERLAMLALEQKRSRHWWVARGVWRAGLDSRRAAERTAAAAQLDAPWWGMRTTVATTLDTRLRLQRREARAACRARAIEMEERRAEDRSCRRRVGADAGAGATGEGLLSGSRPKSPGRDTGGPRAGVAHA
jgi:hypothetical protein